MSESVDAEPGEYSERYRKKNVDERLDDVERRITRLEKVALVTLGYGLATGADIITTLTTFL